MDKAQKKYVIWVITVILVALGLRLFMLTQQSLWNDEGWSLHFSAGASWQDVVSRLLQTSFADRFQPLYFIMLYGWRSLVGDSEATLRVFSVLCGTGAVTVFFFAALRMYGKQRALWSLLIASISTYLIYYSQEVRPYGLLILLVALQFYVFSKALENEVTPGESRWRLLFWIVTGISIFASIFMALFSVSLCLSYALAYRQIKRWAKWWIPAACFALPAVVFHASSSLAGDPSQVLVNRLVQPIYQNVLFVPYGLLVGASFGPPLEKLRNADRMQVMLEYWPPLLVFALVCVMLLTCLLWVLRIRSRDHQRLQPDCFFVYVLLIMFAMYIIFARVANFNWQPRHSFPLYFPIAFLLSTFFDNKQTKNWSHSVVLTCGRIAVVMLLILNIYSLSHYFFDQRYRRDDYRAVAEYLSDHPRIPTIVLYGRAILLKYYGYDGSIDGTNFHAANLAETVMEKTNQASTIWIVVNREFYWNLYNNAEVEESMAKRYRKVEQVAYHYFTIYKFQRKS